MPFNASVSEGNKYLFLTNDPIIEFVGDFQNVTYFDIYYRINLLTTKGVIDVTRENLNIASVKLNDMDLKMNIFKQELDAIKSSRGYRLLERLRCIKRRYLGCI